MLICIDITYQIIDIDKDNLVIKISNTLHKVVRFTKVYIFPLFNCNKHLKNVAN